MRIWAVLRWGCFLVLVGILSACRSDEVTMQERGPTRSIVTVDGQQLSYNFREADTWDIFTHEGDLAHFQLISGVLQGYVAADRGYVLSGNHVTHTDVIINAEVQQTSGLVGAAYGVMCRADEWGNGYYFLLSGTGEFSISVGTPARNALFELIPWQYHSEINAGMKKNTLRAVCVGDYLAMFINDVFVAETRDHEFTSGMAAVVLGAVAQPATVNFDNILIRGAEDRGPRG